MTTGARKILGMKGRVKVVFGGASASKTYSIIPMLMDRAIENKEEVITIVSDTARNLRDGAERDFKVIMKSMNRWDRNRWKETTHRYEFKNGSVIEFLGADDPDKFRGPRRDRLYINEANRLPYETYKQLNLRTRKEVIMDWNPTAPFWYDHEIKGRIAHEWLRLTYLDNESLSEQEMGEFATMKMLAELPDARVYDINYWRVYGLGLTGQIDGACIKDFRVCEKHKDGSFWYNGECLEGYSKSDVGLDFGDNHPNAAVQMYKHENGNKFIFDEFLYKNKMTITEIYNVLKKQDSVIWADYNFPQTIRELKKMKLTIHKCRKGPDSIKHGIDLLNEKEIYITNTSNNLHDEFNSYRYKKDRDGYMIDGKYEGPDHLVDACRYVLGKNVKRRTIRVIQI